MKGLPFANANSLPRALILLLNFGFLSAGAHGQVWWSNNPQLNCGKYTVFTYPNGAVTCQRYGVFPWYAAGGGWRTQIPMFVTPTSQNKAVQMQIGLGTGPILGLGNAAAALFGGLNGSYSFTALAQPIISAGTSGRFDIQNGAFCNGNNCTAASNLAVGALWIQIDAPDLETLERAGTQLVYIYSDPTAAGNNTAAVAVPPVFSDVAIDRWMTSFSETPLENRVNNINANTMSFAVTNFSDVAQSVTITLYDQYSHVIATKATPVLPAGTRVGAQVKPGGVYGDSFVNFFALRGSSLTDGYAAGDAQRTGTIDGSIVFQGSEGQPIAPLVVRGSGRSTAVLLVTPAP